MKRWIVAGVLAIAFLGILVFAGFMWLNAGFAKTSSRHYEVRADFFRELASQDCLMQETIRKAAEARGWRVEAQNLPDTEELALFIRFEPQAPFTKGLGTMFRFDAQGCLLR